MLRLKDIMTTDVVTVTPQTSLRDAMELLASRHVGGAPVVSGNKLVGVISAYDLLSFAASTPGAPAEATENVEWGSFADANETDRAIDREDVPGATYFSDMWDDAGAGVRERMAMVEGPEWNVLESHDVSEAMTRPLITLPSDADVTVAADVMRRNGIHRVLVVDGHTMVGIVSALDIVRAVADHKLEARRFVFGRTPIRGHKRWP